MRKLKQAYCELLPRLELAAGGLGQLGRKAERCTLIERRMRALANPVVSDVKADANADLP